MAFQLSPGVLVTEEDRTTVVPSVATTAGAFAGAFKWGPVDEVITIDSENNLVERFGRPDDATAGYFFTAANFLSYGNNLKIVRTVDKAIARNSVSVTSGKITGISITGSANTFTSSASDVTVTVAPPASGITATGTAVISPNAIVSSVTMITRGFGYSQIPDVQLTGGGGTGATAIATIGAGNIANLFITNAGNNYTNAANIVIQNQDSTSASANIVIEYKIAGLQLDTPGNYPGYNANSNVQLVGGLVAGGTHAQVVPIVGYSLGNIFVSGGGSGYTANSNIVITGGNPISEYDTIAQLGDPAPVNFRPATANLVLDPNTGTILSVTIDFNGGIGYRTTPTVVINRNGGSGNDATLVAELLDISGEIRAFTFLNNGNGYISAPNVIVNRNFPGLTGTEVPVTANLGYGYIAKTNILNPGLGGYSFTPNVVINRNDPNFTNQIFNGEITARIEAQVQEIIITNPGRGYTSAPNVLISEFIGDIATLTAPATAAATLGYSVVGVNVTNEGSGYTSAPVVTVINSANATATATPTVTPGSILIENKDVYDASFAGGNLNFGEFASKYPGTIGNGIRVSMADAATFDTWQYASQFDAAPSTSGSVSTRGGSNDELHVIVIDSTSELTGVAGTVLEKFSFLSKARDAKNSDQSTNYYKDVINNSSKYIYVIDHPASMTNWGQTAAGRNFSSLAANVTSILSGGVDGNGVSPANIISAYNNFANDELYDISLMPLGPSTSAAVVNAAIAIAETRRDCMVFASPPYSDVVNTINQASRISAYRDTLTSSSYAVLDSGWKYQYDRYNDTYRYVPLNGDTAGLAARTDYIADPWFSPAGYNRGVIKNVVKLAYSPTKTDRDTLYKKGVNPVVTFPGQGTLLFGDKTLLARPSAFDRINVRRLFIVLEKAIATASKFQLFEFNDAFTRAQFRNLVEPFLRDVQGRRGITEFRVICDETNNTAEVIDRNEFIADIFIKPARAINFIQLNFIATRSGVSFEEVGA